MNDHLINAKELSRLLDVPITWVWAATREDRIPYIRVGRYLRFDWEEVLDSLPRGGIKVAEVDNVIQFPTGTGEELSQEQGSIV
jgi:hypothetical protein